MSETPIGSIVGFLRLEADQFHRELVKAISEVEALEGKSASVKLDVDTSGVERGAERVASSTRKAASGMDAMSASSRRLTDATDRVKLAEVKLAEAHERRGAKQSQILSAEKALTLALRAQQDAVFDTYSENLHLADSNDKVDESNRKVNRSSREAKQGIGALVTAIVTLGPALVPIAAGAIGLGAAFGGMGIAGVAAFMGIRSEMAKSTTVGLNYAAGIHQAEDAMSGLGKVAATNVLGSFQTVVRQLVADAPRLTHEIGDLSTMTGNAAAHLAGGLLSVFLELEPVMRDAGTYVVGLTRRFDEAMSGGGVTAFGDYVRSVLPQVTATLEEVVTAAGHLVAGFAPLGMGSLTLLQTLAELINAIPVEVLQTLAPLATGVFVGFKTWGSLSGIVSKFGTMLEGVGVSAERAATGMRALNIASGVIGAGLAILTVVMTAISSSNRDAQQSTDDFTQALIASNGAINDNVRATAIKKLQDEGAFDASNKLGISQKLVTDAVLGVSGAQQELARQMDVFSQKQIAAQQGADGTTEKMADQNNALVTLKGIVGDVSGAMAGGVKGQQDYAAAMATGTVAITNEAVAAETLAARYGMSVATYQAVKGAAQQQAQAHANATAKMQLENDAAGLLKQSLDALAGKSLSAAQAQNGFDRAIVSMSQSTRDAKGHIDKAKTALKGMGDAAVTNRGNLLNLASQANGVAEAVANQTGSTEKGRQKLIAMRKQIIDTAVAQGMNRTEVQKFIDTILKVPTHVPPTKADADTTAAKTKMSSLKAQIIDTMRDRQANMFIHVGSNIGSVVGGIQAQMNAIGASIFHKADGGKIPGYAGGGKLRGPGTGTSDSIQAYVRQTGRPVALSTGEYVSTAASTSRNEAALEAGNKGATLGVVGEGGGGDVELSERSLQRLAAILQGVPLEVQMSTSRIDRALVGG